ncbi:hypothetical protein BGW42_001483 [Actinomortierella wolfii]|nr:hypothetical protein BGW42_001483 [Actinomortierella wolfii]
MSIESFTPLITIACVSAVVVMSVYFYCYLKHRRKARRAERRRLALATPPPNTVEIDLHDRSRENDSLLFSLPVDMRSNFHHNSHTVVDVEQTTVRPSRMVHPIDRAHRAAAAAAAAAPARQAPSPTPEDPLALGVSIHPANSKRTVVPKTAASTVTMPAPAATTVTTTATRHAPPTTHRSTEDPLSTGTPLYAANPRRAATKAAVLPPIAVNVPLPPAPVAVPDSPREQVAKLFEYNAKEEYQRRTVQQDVSDQTAIVAATAPTDLSSMGGAAATPSKVRTETDVGDHEDDEDENKVRTQPLEQLPRPIGSFRSPRMPAALPVPVEPSTPYRPPSPSTVYRSPSPSSMYRPASPSNRQQQPHHPRCSPLIAPAAIITTPSTPAGITASGPSNNYNNNNNNNNYMNNNNNQNNEQVNRSRKGTKESTITTTPSTPPYSPSTPFPLASPTSTISSPTSSPPSSPSTGPSPPPPRSQARPRAAPSTALISAIKVQVQVSPATILAAKDAQRASSSTTGSSSTQEDSASVSELSSNASNPRKRVLNAPQNPSGLGARLSTFNYE